MPSNKNDGSFHDSGGERRRQLNWAANWLFYEGKSYIISKIDGVTENDHAQSIISELFIKLAAHPRLLSQIVNAKNPIAYFVTVLKRFSCDLIKKERKRSMIILTGEKGSAELRKRMDASDLYKDLIRKDANFLRKIKFILTPREYKVFIFRAYEYTEPKIAKILGLKLGTVKGYSKSMRTKLRARDIDFFDVND